MSTDTKVQARSLRRRYRRNKVELEKALKGKTLGQAKTKANIELFGLDVIERYFALKAKAEAKAAEPKVKAAKAGKADKSKGTGVKANPKKKVAKPVVEDEDDEVLDDDDDDSDD